MYLSPTEGELGLSEVEKLTSIARSCMAGPDSVARREGEYFVAVEPNSFGIPSVDTCPGRTDYCEQDCYAIESERRTSTYDKLQRNLDVLREDETVEGMTVRLRSLVQRYNERADRLKINQDERRFRIHWSGDFFSLDYAESWRNVMEENPDMKFFAYTRSFQPDVNVLPVLADVSNLDLFISVDCQNVDEAAKVVGDHPNVRVAYLVDYKEEADELIEKLDRKEGFRKLACPENMRDENGVRKLPVISKRGGACSRCTYCIGKREKDWDVIFVKEGYEERPEATLPFNAQVFVEITRRRKRGGGIAKPVGGLAINNTQDDLEVARELVSQDALF